MSLLLSNLQILSFQTNCHVMRLVEFCFIDYPRLLQLSIEIQICIHGNGACLKIQRLGSKFYSTMPDRIKTVLSCSFDETFFQSLVKNIIKKTSTILECGKKLPVNILLGKQVAYRFFPGAMHQWARVRFPVPAPYVHLVSSPLASAGFLRVLRFSLLHLKLDFLNKCVSMHHIEEPLEFNTFAPLGFAWFSTECYK